MLRPSSSRPPLTRLGLDSTIAADVRIAVYREFADIERLPWGDVGFPMASVFFILFFGRL